MKQKQLNPDDVTHLYVGCSMTPPSEDMTAADLDHVHRLQGYTKIAVHYVIRRDGTVERGRQTLERGAFSPNDNDRTVQVCLIGGVNEAGEPEANFTTKQIHAYRKLRDSFRFPVLFAAGEPLNNL